jgi:hypothetical protein
MPVSRKAPAAGEEISIRVKKEPEMTSVATSTEKLSSLFPK